MKVCHFCHQDYERGINASHWTGTEYIRVNVCSTASCRKAIASAPRRPRRPRQAQPLYGDVAWVALANGLDIYGQRA